MESERYHFLIVPKLLMKDMRFSHVSAEAKLMYGLLLDRNALSQKNGWLDEQNRVYIIYTIEEMRRDLGCATEKISKVLKELETIGLLYRKRNGRGKPNYLYVMDYMAIYRTRAVVQGAYCEAKNFENRNVIRLSITRLIVMYQHQNLVEKERKQNSRPHFITFHKESMTLRH